MNEGRLSEIQRQISNQITELKEVLETPDPRNKKFINSIQQSYRVLLELDEKNITPKLNDSMQKLAGEIERLKTQVKPDQTILRSVLAVFEALQEDLKIVKKDPEKLKRGERVEKVENERME